MSIPETQLETWCNQGATVTSAAAYASIKTALAGPKSKVHHLKPEIYLQGSYGNGTNIFADSDVDITVQLNSVWGRDLSALSAEQEQLYHRAYLTASYSWKEFYTDVLDTLRDYFGVGVVSPGNKAVRVTLSSGRTVDIVPAFLYRKYGVFFGNEYQSYVLGTKFEDRSGRVIINYPKEHIKNGETKNSALRTDCRYKHSVRMFTNARNCAIERKLISGDLAPSYFVECLIYNVPDQVFTSNRQDTFVGVVKYLNAKPPVGEARCQNGQVKLFGSTPEQWDVTKAGTLINALISLWNNW